MRVAPKGGIRTTVLNGVRTARSADRCSRPGRGGTRADGSDQRAERKDLAAETGGEAGQQLPTADGVQDDDRQRGQDDRGQDRRYVDAELALEGPQRQRQRALVRALGQDQRQEESVPDGQTVVDA